MPLTNENYTTIKNKVAETMTNNGWFPGHAPAGTKATYFQYLNDTDIEEFTIKFTCAGAFNDNDTIEWINHVDGNTHHYKSSSGAEFDATIEVIGGYIGLPELFVE